MTVPLNPRPTLSAGGGRRMGERQVSCWVALEEKPKTQVHKANLGHPAPGTAQRVREMAV